jgi:hypothetical protein
MRMLKIKKVAIDTEPENTVFLSRRCAAYRAEEFRRLGASLRRLSSSTTPRSSGPISWGLASKPSAD